uniref:(California timema) hypothetical protein n=1 Tax=Timema californicum TaxID=61474 RepID=A0A7R9P520_TIMCA|nr:unnamed protein product [Timema californicum]
MRMAQLKMDRRMIPNQRKRRINSLMSELSLTKCCHTRLSDLSGGEKKRLALAVQVGGVFHHRGDYFRGLVRYDDERYHASKSYSR